MAELPDTHKGSASELKKHDTHRQVARCTGGSTQLARRFVMHLGTAAQSVLSIIEADEGQMDSASVCEKASRCFNRTFFGNKHCAMHMLRRYLMHPSSWTSRKTSQLGHRNPHTIHFSDVVSGIAVRWNSRQHRKHRFAVARSSIVVIL